MGKIKIVIVWVGLRYYCCNRKEGGRAGKLLRLTITIIIIIIAIIIKDKNSNS